MKKIFTFIALVVMTMTSLQARVNRDGEIVVGSGTGSNNGGDLPTSTYYRYSYTQQIYLASELNTSGTVVIDRVSLQYFYATQYVRNITIYLGHTLKTAFANGTDWIQYVDLQEVFVGEVTFNNSGDDKWVDIVLDQPFVYNGTDNLVIAVDDNTGSYNNSSSKFYTHSTSSNYRALAKCSDSENYDPTAMTSSGSRYGYVNNIKFRTMTLSCLPPSLVVSDIQSRQVTLTFKSGNDGAEVVVEYKHSSDSDWTAVTEPSPCTITGLTPGTVYEVRAKNDCGGGEESFYVSKAFRTPSENLSVIHVTPTGAGNRGGSSWDDAMGSLTDALQLATVVMKEFPETRPDIWVAAGTYMGDGISDNAFTMLEGVDVYGGFAGTETSLDQRVKGSNETILDGQNAQRVLYQDKNFAAAKETVWDGFTIQNGRREAEGPGVYMRQYSILQNCKITNNATGATSINIYGGGVYMNYGTLRDCEVCYNNNGSTNYYAYCGGVYCAGNSVIERCDIHHNTTLSTAGGLYVANNSTMVTDCEIHHNTASRNVGGVYSYGRMTNCKIYNNTSAGNTGGLQTGSNSIHVNCLIANNTSVDYGGGVYVASNSQFVNCDIVSNLVTNANSSYSGGGVFCSGSVTFTNTVVWGNKKGDSFNDFYVNGGTPTMKSCAITGGYIGEGTFSLSVNNTGDGIHPKFASPTEAGAEYEGGDWTLLEGSALINKGDDTAISTVGNDLAGTPRVKQGRVDIGVYESDFTSAFEIVADKVNNRIYVKQGATGNGSSWDSATPYLDMAVSAASAMTPKPAVWVAAGTYYGNATSTNAFNMQPGVSVYGGFAGDETSLDQRVKGSNETILDGQNTQRVLIQEEDFTAVTAVVWDGFTIQNGGGTFNGTGVYMQKYSTLRNCKVRNNVSTRTSGTYGGGVYAKNSTVEDCEIYDNSITYDNYGQTKRGGGVYIENGVLRDCDIHDNTIPNGSYNTYGGGVNAQGTTVVENCHIHDNSARGYGGGICTEGNNSTNKIKVTNCVIEGNTSDSYSGGGVRSTYSEFTNCKIINNICNSEGGGVYSYNYDTYQNCLIANNTSSSQGGGVYVGSYYVNFIGCDIVANLMTSTSSSYSGGGFYSSNNNITLTNCVIWGNKKNDAINNVSYGSYAPTVTYSAVEGGYNGIGNISLSSTNDGTGMYHPKFTLPATAAGAAYSDGVWTLQEGSALINKGVTEGLELYGKDLAGNARVQQGKVDIGAYESAFDAAFEIVATDGIIYVSADGSGSKNGSSWANATPYLNMALTEASKMTKKPVIYVKAGTYYGDPAVQNAFWMKEGVNVYGGFAGNETSLDQRDITFNVTILDGQNTQRVLCQDDDFTEQTATVWDGFTIRNGGGSNNGVGAYLYKYGTLRNCILTNNNSTNRFGGAVYLNHATLENCKVHHNSLIYNSNGYAYGGGVYNYNGTVKNCEIYDNSVSNTYYSSYAYGGGLCLSEIATAENCYIHDNTSGNNGGGVYSEGYNNTNRAVMKNCRIENNTSQRYGGGVASGSYSTYINCNIANNTSYYYGGGVYISGNYNNFVNCNIVNNLLANNSYDGAGLYCSSSYNYITNCIIWGNRKNDVSSQIYGSSLNVTYSAIEGGFSGAGNIFLSSDNTGEDIHPMFEHPSSDAGAAYSDGNWALQMGSACINNGTTESLPDGVVLPDTDVAGNQRIQKDYVDIGAYESPYKAIIVTHDENNRIYVTVDGAGEMDGTSWENATPYLQVAVNRAATFTPKSTVWVKEGNYIYTGTSDNCFTMTAGVEVYGGFDGTETELSQRDFEAHPTVLDGGGTKRVLYQSENYTAETEAVWDGFTIKNGYYTSDCSAVYMRYYSRLRNCKIINNSGACPVYMSGYSTIENSLVADNASVNSSNTSGVYMGSYTTLKHCTVVNNTNEHSGAGVYVSSNGVKIYDCIIWGNKRKQSSVYVANNISGSAGNMDVRNTAVEGGYSGIGTIPLMAENTGGYGYHVAFVDPEHGNYNLSPNSLCLKKASDGLDMGAFQSSHTPLINIIPDANNVIYVAATGAGSKDGSSWANATPYLQLAVNLANTFTPTAQVWVKAGTYYGIMAYSANAFEMAPGVKVYGGFAGTETTLAERDFRNNTSILDGGGNRRVLNQQYGFTSTKWAEWDGFTIRNGKTTNESGGGVYMRDYSKLKNCKILNNEATGGGGIYLSSSNSNECDTVAGCIIQGNKSNNNYGGGIYVSVYGYITNCLITNNTGYYGGGVYSGSQCFLVNTTIANNSTNNNGGGIYGYLPTMRNCVVWGNRKGDVSDQIAYNGSYSNQLAYCAIEGGGFSGAGNITLESSNNGSGLNPNFMSPTTVVGSGATGGDWTLNNGSVLINKGTTEGIVVPVTDLAGNARVYDGKIDLGPYESDNQGGLDIVADAHNIVYVRPDGSGDGSSWSNAAGDLQFAVNRASAFSPAPKVWVVKGVYTGIAGNNNAFVMAPGVSVYGGFAGDETFVDANDDGEYDNYDQRDFFNNATILDGREMQRVLMQSVNYTAETAASWDGFTIRNGRINGYGAGVYMRNYSTLRNCKVIDNESTNSSYYGGGIYSTGYSGGNESLRNLISNCEIRNNKSVRGGGVWMSYTILENCKVIGNEANYTYGYGGGVYSESGRISNCEISGNTAYYYGGVNAGSTRIVNSTIVCNTTTYNNSDQAAVYMSNSYMDNSIVFGNEVGSGMQVRDGNNNNPVNNCAIQGGYTGNMSGNNIDISADSFVDAEHDVFDLLQTSTAVNAGNNAAQGIGTKDLNGKDRIHDATVDIGAYEYYCLDYRYVSKTIGYGNEYDFYGSVITEPGRYSRRWLEPGHSCDSLVVLDIRVSSAIYYVTATGAGERDGSSWDNAMSDINNAILHAHNETGFDSKQVWVAAGTYTLDGNNSFELMEGVSVYGGFAGGETSLSQRDPETNKTLLSSTSTYYHLLKPSTTFPPTSENKAKLDGFTLKSGTKAFVNENTILTNITTNVKIEITGGTLENVLFTNMDTKGGLLATNTRIKNCVFTENDFGSSNNSLITLNNSVLDTCQIYSNIVNRDVIYAEGSTITGVSIFNNTGKCGYTPSNNFGAIINARNTTINHCNILNNNSVYSGYWSDLSSVIYNMEGGGSHSRQYKYTIIALRNSLMENTIVWGNAQNIIDNNFIAKDRDSEINYCAIEGSSYNGIGNIRLTEENESGAFSPKFYNPIIGAGNIINQDSYDWTLKYGSVCLKQGRDGSDIGAYSSTNPRAMFLIENPVSHKVYVAPVAVGAKDGSSWNDATSNLQYAVSRANTFDPPAEVWVKEGVYTGDGVSSNAAFNMVEGVNVYGGFAGNEPFDYDVKKRDLDAHKSILDGQGVQRVLMQNEPFDDTTRWDGFVIRNGYLNDEGFKTYNSVTLAGYCMSSYDISHLVGAGALILEKGVMSKGVFENNKIEKTSTGNSNSFYNYIKGAALAVAEGVIDSVTIVNDTTMFNSSNNNMNSYVAAYNALITNSKFNNNFGKIYAVGTTFNNCFIENNAAKVDYDVNDITRDILDVNGSILVNCHIRYNKSVAISKSQHYAQYANTFINCDISRNSNVAVMNHTLTGGDRFINCNIVQNKLKSTNNGVVMISGGAFHNTVVWNNRNSIDVNLDFDRNNLGKYSFNHCAVELGLDGESQVLALAPSNTGTSEVYGYPNFVAPAGGDYDLCNGSALIDAGDNSVVTELKDIMGRDRIGTETVDIGMIESRCINRREYNATTMLHQYPFYDEWLTEPGTYVHRWTPKNSECDSVVVLNLTMKRVFYVKEGGGGLMDGTSWENAFADLRIACDSTAGKEGYQTQIWVAAGLYRGDGTSVNAFTVHPNVQLYGGLTGTELANFDLNDRDLENNVTILDGDYIQRVIFQAEDATEETPVIIDGFKIMNGFSRQDVSKGTALLLKKHCIVRNCTITENYTNSSVGAICIESADFDNCNKRLAINLIENCKITNNQGDVAVTSENAIIRDCEISGNKGTGVKVSSYTKIENCIITGNEGRGVRIMWQQKKFSDGLGFEERLVTSYHDIINSTIASNAGGVFYEEPKDEGGVGDGVYVNTVIAKNNANSSNDGKGGGIYKIAGRVQMYNCTVINNKARSQGGGFYGIYDEVVNTIFYGNTAGSTKNQLSDYYYFVAMTQTGVVVYADAGHSGLRYCAVEGGYPGEGNITLSNDFPVALSGYNLRNNSVCVDAGTTEGFTLPEYDLSGNSRVRGGGIDIGANESSYTGERLLNPDSNNVIYVDTQNRGEKDGSSWENATSELQMAMNLSMTMDPQPEIWVKKGVYTFNGNNDWSMISMLPGVKLYGGFAGTEDASTFNLNDRDFTNNTTFFEAKSTSRAIDQYDNFGNDEKAVIDGFTIRNGAAEQRYKDRIPSDEIAMFEDEFNGGALRLKEGITVRNCDVYGSNANYGGALYMLNGNGSGTLMISNTKFHDNYAFKEGGALYVGRSKTWQEKPLDTIANCEISDNEADRHGGMRAHYMHIVNTSIVKNNTAMYAFDTINSSNQKNEYYNCLLWGNSSRNYANQIEGSDNTYKYCAIQGGYTGEGNINIEKYNTGDDPNLHYANMIDPDNRVYRPTAESYFADRGNNSFAKGAFDLAGKPRINNTTVDMGAYEVGCVEHEHQKIIANEYYVFFGDTLRVSGHYQRQWTQMNGECDSLVSLDLEVRKIWFVTVEGSGLKDGTSWDNAFDDLQTAINAASGFKTDAKKQIWVAKGTYRGNGTGTHAFTLKPGVEMYGGFEGTETNGIEFSERDLETNQTILDGSSSQRVIGNYNAFSKFTLNNNAVVDGFTIQNGYTEKEGGGVYVKNYVKVQNCVIKQNQGGKGAGIYADNKCEITDCKIFGNTALTEGGGAWIKSSTFTYCEINNNLITNIDDESAKYGGGIYGENATINNCLIANNSVLTDNSYGGGMYIANSTLPSQLLNCTVVNNFSYNLGGGVYSVNSGSNNDFINCILWGNRTDKNTQQVAVSASNVPIYVRYSAIQGGAGGLGTFNLSATNNDADMFSPKFVNPTSGAGASYTGGDWHIKDNSICVNQGERLVYTIEQDLDDELRVKNGRIDIGAYETEGTSEFAVHPDSHNIIYVNKANTTGNWSGDSWTNAIPDLQLAINFAADNDGYPTVWVAKGTYTGNGWPYVDAFIGLNGIDMYGGFAGNEPYGYDLANRDLTANATILDGQNIQRTLHQASSEYFKYSLDPQHSAVYDGFTLKNGFTFRNCGANLYMIKGQVNNMIIENGHALVGLNGYWEQGVGGGGVYGESADITMNNCVIRNNKAASCLGGGYYGKMTFNNCLINNNSAIIDENYPVMNEDVSGRGGGGHGGAKHYNSTIVNNLAFYDGGGISQYNSVFNSVLWGNKLTDNTPCSLETNDIVTPDYNNGKVKYSAIEGGFAGEGNITLNKDNSGVNNVNFPMFVSVTADAGAGNYGNGDWHIQDGSVLVNHGNTIYRHGDEDLDGTARIKNDSIDMGAYESNYNYDYEIVPDSHNIVYVSENGAGSMDGSSWADATPYLQFAMERAGMMKPKPVIWVAAGTYVGNGVPYYPAFILPEGVNVYGGFFGNEAYDYDLSLRDFDAHVTTLDGQNLQQVMRCDKTNGSNVRNIIDGFVFTHGRSNREGGGGAFEIVDILNCKFNNNSTTFNDEGSQSPARNYGAGGVLLDAYSTMKYCEVTNNTTNGVAGGVHGGQALINCLVKNNTAGWNGGGLMNTQRVENSEVSYNTAGSSGGGMFGVAEIRNTTVVKNNAAVNSQNQNDSGINGGGIKAKGDVKVYNSIVWGNKCGNVVSNIRFERTLDMRHSACERDIITIDLTKNNLVLETENTGDNIKLNYVSFLNPDDANGDFQLDNNSSCIDMGDNALMPAEPEDLAGNDRVIADVVDMGCYEQAPLTCPGITVLNVPDDDIDFTTARVTWTPGGTESNWVVYYDVVGDNNPTLLDVTSNDITLTGLTSYTDYYVKVRAKCSDTDMSPYSTPFYFSTLCDPDDIVWTNVFDEENILPSNNQPMVSNSTILFSWDYIDGADSYDVYLWRADDGHGLAIPSYPCRTRLTTNYCNINLYQSYYDDHGIYPPNAHDNRFEPIIPGYLEQTDDEDIAYYAWYIVAHKDCATITTDTMYFNTALPDLHITAMDCSYAQTGQPMTVEWTVRNDGHGPVPTGKTWTDYIILSYPIDWSSESFNAGNAESFVIAEVPNLTSLAVGESYTNNFNITVPDDMVGAAFLFVVSNWRKYQPLGLNFAQYGGVFPNPYTPSDTGYPYYYMSGNNENAGNASFEEINGSDNFFYKAIEVDIPPIPDLIVDYVVPPYENVAGDSITISWQLINQGGAGFEKLYVTDNVYITTDTTFSANVEQLGQFSDTLTLMRNDTITRVAKFKTNERYGGKNYNFFVQTDVRNKVYESLFEHNNVSQVSEHSCYFIVPEVPDLVVNEMALSANPVSPKEKIKLTYTVRNAGFTNTGTNNNPWINDPCGSMPPTYGKSWSDRIYISDTAALDLNSPNTTQLATASNSKILWTFDELDIIADTIEDYVWCKFPEITPPDESANPMEWEMYWEEKALQDIKRDALREEKLALYSNSYTKTLDLTIPSEYVEDDYYVFVVTDRNDNIFEHDHNDNNTLMEELYVVQPDLKILYMSLSAERDSLYYAVTNIGDGTVFDGYIDASVNYNNSNVAYSGIEVDTMLKGDTIHDFIPLELECNFYAKNTLKLSVFGENESDFTNNVLLDTLLLYNPDFFAHDVEVPSSEIYSNDIIEITYKITNNGELDFADTLYNGFYLGLSPELNFITAQRIQLTELIDTILVGETKTYTQQLTIPVDAQGIYYLYVYVNDGEQICEGANDHTDYIVSEMLNITLSPYPDLVATELVTPDHAIAGSTVQVSYTIENQGTTAANSTLSWTDKLYVSSSPVFDESTAIMLKSEKVNGSLSVGDSYSRTMTVTLPSSISDNQYFYLVTDAYDNVYEYIGENNNVFQSSLVQVQLYDCDLAATAFSGPASVKWGEVKDYSFTVTNIGGSKTVEYYSNGVYLSTDYSLDNSDIKLKSFSGDALNGGQAHSGTVSVTIPYGTEGDLYMLFVADYEAKNPDKNRNNNVYALPVNVSSSPVPDLEISDVNLVTEFPASGQPIRIAYKVTNVGDGVTDVAWKDKIFMSRNTLENSYVAETKERELALQPGEYYCDTTSFVIPIPQVGNFAVYVTANARLNAYSIYNPTPVYSFFEMNYDNNQFMQSVNVDLNAPGDLVVEEIEHPYEVISGSDVNISWHIKNLGPNLISGQGCSDVIYLSKDQTFDNDDVLLGNVEHSIVIPNYSYETYSYTANIGGVPEGEYYIIVYTDARNAFYEVDETNNRGFSVHPIKVELEELVFDSIQRFNLKNLVYKDYKLKIYGNVSETVRIHVTTPKNDVGAVNNIYVKHNDVGSNMDFDFSTNGQMTGNSEVYIPATKAGYYGVSVWGYTPDGNSQDMTIEANILPFEIRSVEADKGGNTGKITVKLIGSKFRYDMPVILYKGEFDSTYFDVFDHDIEADVIKMDTLYYVNFNEVFVTFDLTGAELGTYNIAGYNYCAGYTHLDNCFTVVKGEPENLSSNLIIPSGLRQNRYCILTLEYGNIGTNDIVNPRVQLVSNGGSWIGLRRGELNVHKTELEIPVGNDEEPAGILRPGVRYTVSIYCFTNEGLLFTINVNDEVYRYEQFKNQMNNDN